MEEMIGEVSKSVQAKPWLLAVAGLAVGLFFFSMVAGSRVLAHVLPAPSEPAAGEQAASPFSALPDLPALPGLSGAKPSATPATPLATPTPACPGASLTIGTTQFQVQSFVPAAGELSAPGNAPGVAYWAEGTQDSPVFLLAALPENQALLAAARPGDPAVVVWPDCNTTTYALSATDEFPADPAALLEPGQAQLAVLVPPGGDAPGLMVAGGLQGQVLLVIPTQAPDEGGVLAEVSLLEAGPSADGSSFEAQVAIYNYGSEPFNVTGADVALLPAVGTTLEAGRSRPRLPERVRPGETKEFTFSFPPPGPGTATLRVLGVEYEVAP